MEEEREGGGGCAVCSNLPIWRYFYLLCSQEGTGREEIESEADEVDHLRQLSLAIADWLTNVHSLFHLHHLLFAL